METGDGYIENTEDYFVFPKLTAEGGAFPKNDNIYSAVIQEQDIFDALKNDRAIRITGSVGSGKTTLISHLYAHSVDYGFIPLLIERGDYRDSKIDRMFKGLFENQYGSQSYHVYSQAANNRKIVFIDDADDITSKTAFENLVNSILESGQLLIYTTTEKNQDLAEIVRARLTGKESSNLDIWPVYKETRDSIVQKIGKKCGKAPEEIDNMIALLDYAAQCHPSIFSLTPSTTLQYIKSFFGGEIRAKKDVQTISAVFENNIRTSIFSKMDHGTANIYLIALDFLADRMYFNLKAENITLEQLASIIEEYNKKRKTKIDSIKFLDGCRSANLLKHCEGGRIGFYDNNTYAYFVAKAINREFENDPTNKEKLLTVMNYICFGINDTIILFLSFIRSNKNLIIQIASKALELLHDFPAWDIEGNNLPFLLQSADMPNTVPTEREKKETHQSIEMVEKARHDSIQFRGIFDYNESDVSKRGFVIAKAMKYTRLVGRALVDQYGFLEESDLDIMLQTLYNVPQKVIYSLLSPVQEHCDEIVKGIVDFFEETYPGQSIPESKVREALGVGGTEFFLNILNDVAFNAANGNTIHVLRDGPIENTNHKLLRFMMEENADRSDEFVKKAVEFRQECENNPYLKMVITQIVRKHIIFHSSIDHTLIDKLISGKVLSIKSKPSLLLTRQAQRKD